jgi:hypothetical protein
VLGSPQEDGLRANEGYALQATVRGDTGKHMPAAPYMFERGEAADGHPGAQIDHTLYVQTADAPQPRLLTEAQDHCHRQRRMKVDLDVIQQLQQMRSTSGAQTTATHSTGRRSFSSCSDMGLTVSHLRCSGSSLRDAVRRCFSSVSPLAIIDAARVTAAVPCNMHT